MRTLPWVLVLLLVGCDGDGGGSDAGPRADAGDTRQDAGSTSGDSGTPPTDAGRVDSGGAGDVCPGGPLAAPIPGCMPTDIPDSGDPYQDCVDRINQFRAECQCLPPLERWTEAEDCADQQAQYDSEGNGAHAGFNDRICDPRGSGQNECPGYRNGVDGVLRVCLQQMWDEGPGENFQMHGHYLNMTNDRFNRVACGFYTTSEGRIWSVQNFAR
ncbi:MAG: CAP domain-containing protein [Sandaracinaceae bacterium]